MDARFLSQATTVCIIHGGGWGVRVSFADRNENRIGHTARRRNRCGRWPNRSYQQSCPQARQRIPNLHDVLLEIVTVDDVCMIVTKAGPSWKRLRIHLGRPARFGWALSFVSIEDALPNLHKNAELAARKYSLVKP